MSATDGARAAANLALVQRMLEVYAAHDFDTLCNEIFAPDVVWRVPGHHPPSAAPMS